MQPLLFLGHGSPMIAIENNELTQSLNELGQSLAQPKAILCISAHWQTNGNFVQGSESPDQIYDFYGFPSELHQFKYQAPGFPDLAKRVSEIIPEVQITSDWGVDHGAWTLLCHLFPKANIPVVQFSLNRQFDLLGHWNFAQKLRKLRSEGYLILASGNIVHNLRAMRMDGATYPWALEFQTWVNDQVSKRNLQELTQPPPELYRLAHPTVEHYLPLLYVAALVEPMEKIHLFHQIMTYGAVSMWSMKVG